MKNIILVIVTLSVLGLYSLSFAKTEVTDNKDNAQQFIKMHQDMMKMHQDAISCAQSGKTVKDCMQQFRQSMMEKMKQMKAAGYMMPCPMMQKHMGQPGRTMMQRGNMMQNNMKQSNDMIMQHQGS